MVKEFALLDEVDSVNNKLIEVLFWCLVWMIVPSLNLCWVIVARQVAYGAATALLAFSFLVIFAFYALKVSPSYLGEFGASRAYTLVVPPFMLILMVFAAFCAWGCVHIGSLIRKLWDKPVG